MASSKALIKYYDTLKESFNVIQDTKKSEALINAALRPKIGEEFAKSQDVLNSYLDYIQVFCLIYDDTFSKICSSIVVPLFKCYSIKFDDDIKSNEPGPRVHNTIKTILKAKQSLSIAFVSAANGNFPKSDDDSYSIYIKNCLYSFKYLAQESSSILFEKLLERIDDKAEADKIDQAYDMMYEFFDSSGSETTLKFYQTILDYVVSKHTDNRRLNHMMLYICSKDEKFVDDLLKSLWTGFISDGKSLEERVTYINYASSFIARANYIKLEMMFDYVEKAAKWCHDIVDRSHDNVSTGDIYLFKKLAQSIFYLITQRHRDLYEQETIHKMKKINLGKLLKFKFNPLTECCSILSQRFQEVATLYQIEDADIILSSGPKRKRARLSAQVETHTFEVPFEETSDGLPERIKDLYREYYHHGNFTLNRE